MQQIYFESLHPPAQGPRAGGEAGSPLPRFAKKVINVVKKHVQKMKITLKPDWISHELNRVRCVHSVESAIFLQLKRRKRPPCLVHGLCSPFWIDSHSFAYTKGCCLTPRDLDASKSETLNKDIQNGAVCLFVTFDEIFLKQTTWLVSDKTQSVSP